MSIVGTAIRVAKLVEERGKEGAIKVLEHHLNNKLMMTSTHFEYHELLAKAKRLIEDGKLDELPELDKKLEDLEDYDLWD